MDCARVLKIMVGDIVAVGEEVMEVISPPQVVRSSGKEFARVVARNHRGRTIVLEDCELTHVYKPRGRGTAPLIKRRNRRGESVDFLVVGGQLHSLFEIQKINLE